MSLVDYTKKSADGIIAMMENWIGCVEGDYTHINIIELYNSGKSPSEYRMTLTDPWCATAVGAAAHAIGFTYNEFPISASCDRMIDWLRQKNKFVFDKQRVPNKGDIIFYNWDEDYSCDHTGIVTGVYSGVIRTIEGNCNDTVSYGSVPVGDYSIYGYGVIDYPEKSEEEIIISYYDQMYERDKKTIDTFPELSMGSTDKYVAALQVLLIFYGGFDLEVDCDFGSLTERAVIEWQRARGLEVDGVVGKETWSSFLIDE